MDDFIPAGELAYLAVDLRRGSGMDVQQQAVADAIGGRISSGQLTGVHIHLAQLQHVVTGAVPVAGRRAPHRPVSWTRRPEGEALAEPREATAL